ncbi:uncharacterized protein LOC9648842 [Selaginella moellendorffii]|uniref:uncharacterized protein LOC9648842 n=1 Tax=Selaginella moellendorffii TaxID=88036 RepID=UPI000D1C9B79|nr:uncharacterized protein LOC9648842 [Selaginella moellendorffii]|eukprot:XP_002976272.2 uncharacterized protein LOC9648842 [Selaginella moellendorffii]
MAMFGERSWSVNAFGAGIDQRRSACGAQIAWPSPDDHGSCCSIHRIRESKIVACLRAHSSKLALDAARAALDGGLDVLEVTMTTPGASKVIATLVHEYPSALIGAGTVLSLDQAEEAKASGATFLLSPITVKELVEIHSFGPVLFVPGAMTPTEVYTAHSYGAHIVKIYPTDLAGGVKYVRSLRKLLAHIPMIASQGITLEMIRPYLDAGASAVVLSDAIFDSSSLSSSCFAKITQQASVAVKEAAKNAR